MKLIIENLEGEKIKLTLNFKGKDYTETWVDGEFGYETVDKSIVNQMECDGICCEGTYIEMLLCGLDIEGFRDIAGNEEDW